MKKIKLFKNFKENQKLRKERNAFENKYVTTLEKYVRVLEDKTSSFDEIEKYKNLYSEERQKTKELKIELSKKEEGKKRCSEEKNKKLMIL